MCIAAVNAKGGVKVGSDMRKLEAVKYDYQSETSRAVQIVQRLLTVDKVDFLFAPYGSGDTKATAVLAERYNIPMVATSAASEAVYDQKGKNLFGILFPNNAMVQTEVKYYKERVPQAKKLAVFALNSLFPKAIAAALRDTAAKDGFEVVFDGLYSQGTLDFANVLTQIKAGNPGLAVRHRLYPGADRHPPPDGQSGHEHSHRHDDGRRRLSGIRAEPRTARRTTSPPMHGGIRAPPTRTATFSAAPSSTPRRSRTKYKKEPTYLEAAATAGCEVLVQSVEKAGSTDPEAVRKQLSTLKFDTFYGPIQVRTIGAERDQQPDDSADPERQICRAGSRRPSRPAS